MTGVWAGANAAVVDCLHGLAGGRSGRGCRGSTIGALESGRRRGLPATARIIAEILKVELWEIAWGGSEETEARGRGQRT